MLQQTTRRQDCSCTDIFAIAGKPKVKQEPSRTQPQPLPAADVPATVNEKVREVANAQHTASQPDLDIKSTPGAATNAPQPAGRHSSIAPAKASSDVHALPSAQHPTLKQEDGTPLAEADGTGVFAEPPFLSQAAAADPETQRLPQDLKGHSRDNKVTCAASPAVQPEGGQGAFRNDDSIPASRVSKTSLGKGDVRGQFSEQVTPPGSGVLKDEGLQVPGQASDGGHMQALGHGEARDSREMNMEQQQSDAELLRGAVVAEATAGVDDQDKAATAYSGGPSTWMICIAFFKAFSFVSAGITIHGMN